ncbi:MAG: T9SS type A sorting domain-containing protein [Bacteroidia bacterium]
MVTITTASNPVTYPYFYNWEIEIPNPCPRTPARVITTSGNVTAGFSADQTTVDLGYNATVEFTDMSTGATGWLWDFGDGNTSTDQNPSNQYYYAGNYTITLIASGPDSCMAYALQEIVVEGTYPYNVGVEDALAKAGKTSVFPNPGSGLFYIDFDLKQQTRVTLVVYDQLGREVVSMPEKQILKDRIPLDLHQAENGIYYVHFLVDGETAVRKLIKNR